ncbi:hypothetical protein ACH429_04890 [Streptomyces pathocidini]|uniref:Uncharacterized protein n=1 Tax=Streptomyces pathocidini TaxID=1650571 RepID=A0ABW7UNP6_9ACTN|nr:hypothetical protein [Streptomyces pathocidini]
MNRLLLIAYPKAHRDRYGDELLGCLAEAHPGRAWPPPRETAALLRGALRAHARAASKDTARPWWLDGIHLAALVLAALALVPYLQDVWDWALRVDPGNDAIAFHAHGWFSWAQGPGTITRMLPYGLLPLVALVALLRGKLWIALPASAAMVWASATFGSSTFFGDEGMVGLGYYGLGTPIPASDLMLPVTLLFACGVLAATRPNRLRRRSYGWLVPVALALTVVGGLRIGPHDQWSQFAQLICEVGALAAAWYATASTGDYRWAIPVAAFALVRAHAVLTATVPMNFQYVREGAFVLALVAAFPLLVVVARDRRRSAQL